MSGNDEFLMNWKIFTYEMREVQGFRYDFKTMGAYIEIGPKI